MSRDDTTAATDARRLDALRSLLRRAQQNLTQVKLELFERRSRTVRVTRDDRGAFSIQHGEVAGTAVRAIDRDGRVAFLATTGTGVRAVDWAVSRLHGTAWSTPAPWDRWATGGGQRVDHGEPADPPSEAELREWLAASIEAGGSAVDAWAEAGATRETLVDTAGLAAVRTRSRVWAMIRGLEPGPAGPREIRRVRAARGISAMPVELWGRSSSGVAAAPNGKAAGREAARLDPASPLLLLPGPAALAALTLVSLVHGPGRPTGIVVGPGWCVTDDPRDPAALAGGTFDDAGFDTRETRLADGKQSVGLLDGPGSLRRPSFRDPPSPRPSFLRIWPPKVDQEQLRRCTVVARLRIHPLGERLAFEIAGWTRRCGRPERPVSGAVLASPADWVARCRGGHGNPVTSHRGVSTPALLFDGGA